MPMLTLTSMSVLSTNPRRRIDAELAVKCQAADLVVLEGMGRYVFVLHLHLCVRWSSVSYPPVFAVVLVSKTPPQSSFPCPVPEQSTRTTRRSSHASRWNLQSSKTDGWPSDLTVTCTVWCSVTRRAWPHHNSDWIVVTVIDLLGRLWPFIARQRECAPSGRSTEWLNLRFV